jgi:preprotein translocase SecE subunit
MNWKNILSEIRSYPAGVLEELHKVDWPSRHETTRLSLVAGTVILVAMIYVAGLDLVFSRLIQLVITR